MERLRCRNNKLKVKQFYTQVPSSKIGEDKRYVTKNCVKRKEGREFKWWRALRASFITYIFYNKVVTNKTP